MIHKLWSERDTAPQFGKKAVAATWWQEMKTWTCLETRSVAHPAWRCMRRTTGDHRTSTLLSQVWRAVSDLMQMVFLMHRLDSGCADFILKTAAAHQASDWTVREEIHWPLIIRHDGKIIKLQHSAGRRINMRRNMRKIPGLYKYMESLSHLGNKNMNKTLNKAAKVYEEKRWLCEKTYSRNNLAWCANRRTCFTLKGQEGKTTTFY